MGRLGELGPQPDQIWVHLDAGYDSQVTRDELAARGMTGQIAHRGDQAPLQAGQRWHVERTNVIDAFFDLADTIITLRSLIRGAWTTHRWDNGPARRP